MTCPKLKKKLWQEIIKKLVALSAEARSADTHESKGQQIEQAMMILRKTSVLQINDVLELFPKSEEKADDLKEYLSTCIDDYNSRMQTARTQIEQNIRRTAKLRKERL